MQRVQTYKVQHSVDGENFEFAESSPGVPEVFQGNEDCNNVDTEVTLVPFWDARYVRILPVTWAHQISMRVQLETSQTTAELQAAIVNYTYTHVRYRDYTDLTSDGLPQNPTGVELTYADVISFTDVDTGGDTSVCLYPVSACEGWAGQGWSGTCTEAVCTSSGHGLSCVWQMGALRDEWC